MNQPPDVKTIFHQALAQEPEARDEFLTQACGTDAALRQRVEALLNASDNVGSFMETPIVAPHTVQNTTGQSATFAESQDSDADSTEFDLEFLAPSDKPDCLGMLDHYEIIEPIGRGGMGIVLRGLDTKLKRVVAIKVLAPELAANATARKRFEREAQAAAAVNHVHVVTIFAVDEGGKLPYLMMECIVGKSLQDLIDQEGTLDVTKILRIGAQIGLGLAAAHAQGLVHRDVKPANILLENGIERVKITDFGLARAIDDVSITKTGQTAGTPQYMSPEQCEGQRVDFRSDLFSLGSILYAMCTGRPAFRANSSMAVLRRICEDAPRPIREVNSDIPQWLVQIIDKLLAKDPDQRYQSAAEVAETLGQHLAEIQQQTDGRTPKKITGARADSLPPPQPHSKRNVGMLLTIASLLVVIGLVLTEAAGITRLRDSFTVAGPDQHSKGTEIADDGKKTNDKPSPPVNKAPMLERPVADGNQDSKQFTNASGMEFVLLPKGTFWMGDKIIKDNGKTMAINAVKQFEIEHAFYMGIYEVTQQQWHTVMGDSPSYFSRTGDGHDEVKNISEADLKQLPVEQISWEDVQAFITKLNAMEPENSWEYRLPTQAEWEYACRAGATSKEDCSFNFYLDKPTISLSSTQANFNPANRDGTVSEGPYLGRSAKVGSYQRNALGIYDLHGNVAEWCQDDWRLTKVVRGGSWNTAKFSCRVSERFTKGVRGDHRNHHIGFRLARVPSGK
jgi:serine/threonine protein kinase